MPIQWLKLAPLSTANTYTQRPLYHALATKPRLWVQVQSADKTFRSLVAMQILSQRSERLQHACKTSCSQHHPPSHRDTCEKKSTSTFLLLPEWKARRERHVGQSTVMGCAGWTRVALDQGKGWRGGVRWTDDRLTSWWHDGRWSSAAAKSSEQQKKTLWHSRQIHRARWHCDKETGSRNGSEQYPRKRTLTKLHGFVYFLLFIYYSYTQCVLFSVITISNHSGMHAYAWEGILFLCLRP